MEARHDGLGKMATVEASTGHPRKTPQNVEHRTV